MNMNKVYTNCYFLIINLVLLIKDAARFLNITNVYVIYEAFALVIMQSMSHQTKMVR